MRIAGSFFRRPGMSLTSARQEREHDTVARILWRWQLVAAFILVLVFLGSFSANRVAIEKGALDEKIVNIAGRQRMLSQRILYFAKNHFDFGDSAARTHLAAAIDLFEEGHAWLMTNAVTDAETQAFYGAAGGTALDARSKSFVATARRLFEEKPGSLDGAAKLETLAATAEVALLADLNRAVSLFEARGAEKTAGLRKLQAGLLGLGLAILLLEAVFIARPTHRATLNAIRRLDRAANEDALTGLANRKRFWDRLNQLMEDDTTDGRGLTVVNIDLDGFKAVNDSLGHPAGDAVLRHVAHLLEESVEDLPVLAAPIVARLGGDEFALGLLFDPAVLTPEIEALGDRLLQAVASPFNIDVGGDTEKCVIGLSLGYARASDSGGRADLTVANADIALYESKKAGKNRMTAFRSDMRDIALRRHRIETDIREAVMNSEFVPHYQPLVCSKTGRVSAIEILARWDHPERGIRPASDFLGTASEIGLIDMIEGNILLRAFEELGALRRDALPVDLGHISFNPSMQLLVRRGFLEELLSLVDSNGLAPRDIMIEISEQALTTPIGTSVLEVLQTMKANGFLLAASNFGIGYTSLSCLAQLDLDLLKLDRTLVAHVNEPTIEKVLAATIGIAKGMAVEVASVGVETEKQAHRLRALGSVLQQGDSIAATGDLDALRQWLSGRAEGVARAG